MVSMMNKRGRMAAMMIMTTMMKKKKTRTLVDSVTSDGHWQPLAVAVHKGQSHCRPDDSCGHATQGKLRHIRLTCEHYGIPEENVLLLDDENGNHR